MLVPVAQYLEAREGEKPLGGYALYDASRNLQYVGYGRNIILAVKVGPSVTSHSTLLGGPLQLCTCISTVMLITTSLCQPA